MKITKYRHAFLVLELESKMLVVDPGEYSPDLPTGLDSVAAIIITHKHPDHLDHGKLAIIRQQNPDAPVFAPQDCASLIDGAIAVEPGQTHSAGPFSLKFFGGDHAIVDTVVPAQNVGVMVNGLFYYPGDSFVVPDERPQVVAVPASGPWMKLGEAMAFVRDTKAQQAFPTHDAHLSLDTGVPLHDHWLDIASRDVDTHYSRLGIGESIEVT